MGFPVVTDWDSLERSSKEMYGYFAGIVCSAKGFYSSLKADLEEEFMSSFDKPALNLGAKKRSTAYLEV